MDAITQSNTFWAQVRFLQAAAAATLIINVAGAVLKAVHGDPSAAYQIVGAAASVFAIATIEKIGHCYDAVLTNQRQNIISNLK